MRYFKAILNIFTLLILSLIIQCGKSKITQPINQHEVVDLIGSWKWISSIGGIADEIRTPATFGYNEIRTFNTDSTYNILRYSESDTYAFEGSYFIKYDQTWNDSDSAVVITMNTHRSIVEIVGDTLNLINLCDHCFVETFIKDQE